MEKLDKIRRAIHRLRELQKECGNPAHRSSIQYVITLLTEAIREIELEP